MRRAFVLAAVLAAPLWGDRAYAAVRYSLELRGGSSLCSRSAPVVKGGLYLFHRCPDGTFVSLPAREVVRVREEQIAEKPAASARTNAAAPHRLSDLIASSRASLL